MISSKNLWIDVPRPLPGAQVELLCFPHAGGSASTFFPWVGALERHSIEMRAVQYPGHGRRIAEPLLRSIDSLISALTDQWLSVSKGARYALFGHSLGSLVAYELVAELVRRGISPLPCHLFVSGRNPPEWRIPASQIHAADDETFLAELERRYGTLPPGLSDNKELSSLILPILRADIQMGEMYRWHERPPLDVPITAIGGKEDPWTEAGELEKWQKYTTRSVHITHVDGDHFFHQRESSAVVEIIRRILSPDSN